MSSFSSLGAALSKVGLAPTPDHQPAIPDRRSAVEAEPCAPDVGADIQAMIALIGEARTLRLLSEQASAPYGKDRRAAAITGALQSARDRLPMARSREIADVRPASGRGSDMAEWLDARISALESGGYAAWLRAQQADNRAAMSTAIPELGPDEDEAAFTTRFQAWADQQTVGVLRRLCPASWGSDPDVGGAIRTRIQARRDQQAEAERRELAAAGDLALAAIRLAIASGESLEDLRGRVRAIPHEQSAARAAAQTAVSVSPQAWAAAEIVDGVLPTGDPPQGWAALSLEAVARWAVGPRSSYGHRYPQAGAVAELTRRFGVGATLDHPDRVYTTAPHLWLRADGLAALAGEAVPARVTDVVGPAGWAEPTKDGYQWCGPAVYAALTRVLDRARTPGTLDVSRVFAAYGRHSEKRYPRFWWSVWGRSSITVAVDDALGAALDDLALAAQHCPARVPAAAYWLHAEVRETQSGGGLRVAASRGAARSALVTVQGHTQQLSRRSVGSTPSARADSPALAVTGYAGSAKHSDVRVVACVSEGRPLLLDSGVGYRLGRNPGEVEKVPGLAEGRPGEAVAI